MVQDGSNTFQSCFSPALIYGYLLNPQEADLLRDLIDLKGCCGYVQFLLTISFGFVWEGAAQQLCEDCLAVSSRGKWSQILSCHRGFSNSTHSSECCRKVNRAVSQEKGIKSTAAEQQQCQMPLEGQDWPLGLHLPRKEIRIKIKGRGE